MSLNKALFIAFHFPPGNATGARRPYRFARYLREFGYEAHVVTSEPQTPGAPWPYAYAAPGPNPARLERLGQRFGRWLHRILPYNDQVTWISSAVAIGAKIANKHHISVVFSTSPPVACHLAAWILKRAYHVPWVADFRDPLQGNPFRSRSWGWVWDKPVERLVMSQTDAVVVNTDAVAAMLSRRYPAFSHKIHLIWNGYDPDRTLHPEPIPDRSQKIMVHSGSIYGQRNPALVLASIGRLIAANRLDPARIRIRLIGPLELHSGWVEESGLSALLELGCLEYNGTMVPVDEAELAIKHSEYLLLLDVNDAGVGLQVPAKLFEYIQVGRPILACTNRNSPVERILQRSGISHVCVYPDQSPAEVDERILAFLHSPVETRTPSEYFRLEFDGQQQTAKLARILNSVTDRLNHEA